MLWRNEKMRKMIFLEGLPGVGKTTIVNEIRKLNLKNLHVVDEIINKVDGKTPKNQLSYFLNDEMKLNRYTEGVIIIDRGPISTLSYNITRSIIDQSFDASAAKEWFNQFIDMLRDESNKVLYLTTNDQEYYIPFSSKWDPYGSLNNQRLLEKISIENCKRYVRNVKFEEYHKENMEEIINEIVNEYLCS